MSLIIKDRVYENLTEGLHNVTITKVEDVGPQETAYGTKDRARIFFTASDQKAKDGSAVDAVMTVTKSLHSKSALGKLLNSLGVNAGAQFDLNDVIGIKCQVVIEHKESDGKTYANIVSVLKLRKSTPEQF